MSFKNDILPLFNDHCVKCHGGYNNYPIIQTLANNGQLRKVTITTSKMPKGERLSLSERKKIYCWMEAGAPDN